MTNPPAMPEHRIPDELLHLCESEREAVRRYANAYAIAALQSAQPAAAVSDALATLVVAVEAELSDEWTCNSYHPSLRPALEAARAILALRPQPVPMTDEQMRVLRFLLGESALEDCHFGDMHPDKRGRFWWRENLRKAFAITAQGAQEGV